MKATPVSQSGRIRDTPRSLHSLLAPLEGLASGSESLFSAHLEYQDRKGVSDTIPRFLFTGPGDRGSFLRVGIFAGVHGDEPSGAQAAVELLRRLHADPAPALGYELFVYPVCNPWGYARDTRWLKSGSDMNREFWRGSDEIEVLVLEGQLMKLAFDGIVSLHTDDTSPGLYGFVKGHQLTHHVLDPSLEAASRFLPRNFDKSIDNFQANAGIIADGYTGILGAPPTQSPRPFEIVFETPSHADSNLQVEAHVAAMLTMLGSFRAMIAEAQNI
ncbi:MAG: succinylglutamate desuccinylase/aspartoacylase family protein [Verrucomicrobiota bacterium]